MADHSLSLKIELRYEVETLSWHENSLVAGAIKAAKHKMSEVIADHLGEIEVWVEDEKLTFYLADTGTIYRADKEISFTLDKP